VNARRRRAIGGIASFFIGPDKTDADLDTNVVLRVKISPKRLMSPEERKIGPISLVLAVAGHRDLLIEGDWLEREIRRIFKKLGKDDYPNTPLLLLSGLAKGGDQIVVRVAKDMGIPYIAVLPMPAEDYREDFSTEENVEFEKLLDGATRQIELPPADGITSEQIKTDAAARKRQYAFLGEFLVKYSQILIAIWDEEPFEALGAAKRNELLGGTSHVVAMKLRHYPPTYRLASSRMNADGAGPVYVLPARRRSSGSGATPALKCEIRYPEFSESPEDLKAYWVSYRLQDQFNADVKQFARPDAMNQSRLSLFEGADTIGFSEPMEWVATVYSRADVLAIHFANLSLNSWKAIFILLAVSGIALQLLHELSSVRLFLGGYYACLASASVLIYREWMAKRRGRHEDYRALAEALRVQFFWMAAGLRDMSADQYLRKQAGDVVWIRDAMSECGLYKDILDRSPAIKSDRALRLRLAQNWVEGQANYYSKTKRLHEMKKKTLSIFAAVAVAVGFIAPLFGLTRPFVVTSHVVAAVAMWWAALALNYTERRGFAQEIRQYERMHELFRDAHEDLKKFEAEENFEKCEEIIRELGSAALEENGDWLSMHRQRKLTVPIPGS
jgi:hypothetical protein